MTKFIGIFLIFSQIIGAKMANSKIAYSDSDIWLITGITNCAGNVFVNDFFLQSFNGKKNTMVQIEVLPNVLKKRTQKISFHLEGDCVGKAIHLDDFNLRIAGFKVGESPAATVADSKVKDPFGKFPVMGHILQSFEPKDFNKNGILTKEAGQWDLVEAWNEFEKLKIDDTVKNEVLALTQKIHKAVQSGDSAFLAPLVKYKIESTYPVQSGIKNAANLLANELGEFAARTQSRPKKEGFKVLDIAADGAKFRLLENQKIIEVLDKNGQPLIQWQTKQSGKNLSNWRFNFAKSKGKWILF